MSESTIYDMVIVGGGPAGMTAGIYAARAGLKAVILEENITGGLVNSTYTVENFPSYPTIHGMDLMKKMRAHVDSLEVEVEEVCEIESMDLEGELKTVETDEGTLKAKTVIICTGRKPIPLDVPTECDQVHHCAICDGGPYKGKRVLVVGGGNSAFDESLYMITLGIKHITLIEVMDRFFAAQGTQDQLLGTGKVNARTETKVIDLVVENDELKAAVLENVSTGEQETVPVDGAFVFLGQNPNNELFAEKIKLSKNGYVITDEHMATSIPGVFSAGDINDKAYRQITTAMSDGTIAALAAERYIRT
ncbi:NAD(P)/FAD-dependent oxidoreductase [Maridesulfovibrio salexigens]|uniref:FAD-dependent pyridine nucleotide-disulphide oxidoreductase n=1 Tax=Maridesulfovibrio salexigens (strain ATCC 14822 / DSM 2638 / NCIMB 8403 / VKM B-1763) TaxID=526222 RepID=C6BWZ5_MARSD|nr:FAD-dependent oxidoreductase [Maridesulfovibrio salexigens]ACS78475.1 FAD-dependent pyridine nucleotide-disulphide oxidoreductase [Maridesulfovibrio salexigens DSM 2638]